jgi:hypothetical protein
MMVEAAFFRAALLLGPRWSSPLPARSLPMGRASPVPNLVANPCIGVTQTQQ